MKELLIRDGYKMNVTIIGNMVKETIVYPDHSVGPVLGSPTAYIGLAMSCLGAHVGIVSFGNEKFKNEIKDELNYVDFTGWIPYMYITESHLVYTDPDHNHVEYYRTAPRISFENLPEDYMHSDLYVICPMNYEVDIELIRKLYEQKKRIVVDLGGFGGTTSFNHFGIDTSRGATIIKKLCKYAWIVKCSMDDLGYLMPKVSVEVALKKMTDLGAGAAFITMGIYGVSFKNGNEDVIHYESVPLESSSSVNRTGGGDILTAGFLYATDYYSFSDAIKYGNCMASLAIAHGGYCDKERMPSDRQIREKMRTI